MEDQKHYELKQITEALGIKRTKLQQWMAFGYLQPSVEKASGQGTRNKWSLADVIALSAFGELIKMGLSRSSAARLVNPDTIYEVNKKGVAKSESRYLNWVFDVDDPLRIHDPYLVQFEYGGYSKGIVVLVDSHGAQGISALNAIQLVADELKLEWNGIVILGIDELSKKVVEALQ